MNLESTASQSEKMDTSGSAGGNDLTSPSSSSSNITSVFVGDVISRLYPNVNHQETPLPRTWSTQHKWQTLALTNGNLRVTYKGQGKTHKDAASVRTDFPIPAPCGIYYYEVKIVSKGRDGYMGIGLSRGDVQLNRLPGWDKNSYGYHGDDGHSFCSSGTGQNYGPTFTTGDIIGCCLNLIDNTCFYTKNGYNLGIAFRDMPSDLYPTVGLQTPLECVEANFGQYRFEFDIHNYVKEWHLKTRQAIERFPLRKDVESNLPTTLRKLVSTYLVHHGYSSTAEAFAKSVGHVFEEELASIRNRQNVQKMVLNGLIAEAIELTYQLFPGILENHPNLLFALKVRQFIEMIYDAHSYSNKHLNHNHKPQVQQQQQHQKQTTTTTSTADTDEPLDVKNVIIKTEEDMEMDSSPPYIDDVADRSVISKKEERNEYVKEEPGVAAPSRELDLPKVLEFGRSLFQLSMEIGIDTNGANGKILRDAFSLLAYHDPWNSPLGYQLDPAQREPISAMLNSVILEANNMPRIPPLEVVYGQTNECMRLMSKHGIAWSAYANLADYMHS